MKRFIALLCILISTMGWAGQVSGNLQTANSGAVVGATISFTLNMPAVVSGTAAVVPQSVSCYTSTAGAIVGEPDPTALPVLTTNTVSGTLPSATYFVKIVIQDASGVSLPSPEASVFLSAQGTVIVTAPAVQPSTATGYQVFISTATGTETLQGTVTGTPGSWANYSQSVPLVAGSALPSSNTTACKIRFQDELIPTTTYYTVSVTNSDGNRLSGYPQQYVRFYGGSAGNDNVSTGWPTSTAGVVLPSPIVSSPNQNATQTINGPLNLNGFGLTVGSVTNSGNETIGGTLGVTGATTLSGAVTTKSINNALVVGSATGQFSSMASCYAAASAGQTCLVSPNWSETFGSQLVMSKNNVGFYFLGAASINMSTFGILVNDGVIGAYLNSPSAFGGAPTDTGSGTPVNLSYSGSGAAITAGTVGGSNGVASLGIQNINIDISGGSSAIGINTFCTNHSYLSGVSIIGLNAANTQIGLKMNDCATNGNGANVISGLQIIRPKIGMQFTGNFRENDFAGLRIAGLLTPIAGSIGVDFEGNSKNNFIHGGFCASGFITEFNFGGTANFNDIHCEEDLDDGGGGAQDAVFGSGTFNNEIVRTSDIGAYVYTDNGANNCIRNPGSECIVRRVDLTGQNNNIGATTLMAVPANSTVSNNGGLYRVSCYTVVTTAAGVSSTLPNVQIQWTDNDTNTLASFMNCTPSATGNTVGTTNSNSNAVGAGVPNANTINVKPGTNITWQTVNYASNAANAMQYAVHIRLQYLGQ